MVKSSKNVGFYDLCNWYIYEVEVYIVNIFQLVDSIIDNVKKKHQKVFNFLN